MPPALAMLAYRGYAKSTAVDLARIFPRIAREVTGKSCSNNEALVSSLITVLMRPFGYGTVKLMYRIEQE